MVEISCLLRSKNKKEKAFKYKTNETYPCVSTFSRLLSLLCHHQCKQQSVLQPGLAGTGWPTAQLVINDRSQSSMTQVTKNTREKSIKDSNGEKKGFFQRLLTLYGLEVYQNNSQKVVYFRKINISSNQRRKCRSKKIDIFQKV